MARRTPGFVRDPDQAAELAALLEDTADALDGSTGHNGERLSRAELARHTQTIARYRRWAAELTDTDDADAPAPVQIRPATRGADPEEATG